MINNENNNSSNSSDTKKNIIKDIINQISYLKDINDDLSNQICENSELKNINIGYPLVYPNTIPESITIILDGEARLIDEEDGKPITVAKLGKGSIIGLSSILSVKGYEYINASTIIKALTIPDYLVIKLYENEISFREFCEENIFPSEVLSIANNLIQKSSRSDIKLRNSFNILFTLFSLLILRTIRSELCIFPYQDSGKVTRPIVRLSSSM